MSTETKDQGVPSVFADSLRQRSGLILCTGRVGSGLSELLQKKLKDLSDRPLGLGKTKSDLMSSTSPSLILIQSDDSAVCESVLESTEAGHLVVWEMNAPGPLSALRRLLSMSFGEGRPHLLWRLADQLILMMGQMKIRSLQEDQMIDIFELVLMTPAMKEALRSEDLSLLEEGLQQGLEGSGTVSFNQSLLQHLLRRNIDIKAAFEATRDPMNLDQLLKKVGI